MEELVRGDVLRSDSGVYVEVIERIERDPHWKCSGYKVRRLNNGTGDGFGRLNFVADHLLGGFGGYRKVEIDGAWRPAPRAGGELEERHVSDGGIVRRQLRRVERPVDAAALRSGQRVRWTHADEMTVASVRPCNTGTVVTFRLGDERYQTIIAEPGVDTFEVLAQPLPTSVGATILARIEGRLPVVAQLEDRGDDGHVWIGSDRREIHPYEIIDWRLLDGLDTRPADGAAKTAAPEPVAPPTGRFAVITATVEGEQGVQLCRLDNDATPWRTFSRFWYADADLSDVVVLFPGIES